MTNPSSFRGRPARPRHRSCPDRPPSRRPRGFFSPISNADVASTPAILRAAMEYAFGASDADWRLGLEDRLRRLRGGYGPVPSEIRTGHPRQGRVTGRHAAHAGEDRGPSPHPHAPLRGEPGAPAVLDADSARTRRIRGRHHHPGRSRARAFGRDRSARHPCRARRRLARAERAGRDPRRTARPSLSGMSPSPVSTPRRSTIISTPPLRRAWS